MVDFDRPSLDTIYQRMKADAEQRWENQNWASRALVLIILAVFAGAIYLCYGFLRKLAKQLFFTTSNDEYTRWHGRKYGLGRKPAEFASSSAYRFTGVNTTVVPIETEIESEDGIAFTTDVEVIIASGFADVAITAVESGTDSNIDVADLTLVESINDIDDTVYAVSDISGGVAEETIAEHVTRLLQRTQNPPGSGNESDYERWALSISGVGRVWALGGSDWAGSGTAGVVLASANLEPVASSIKTEVEAYILTLRPIGSSVTVENMISAEVTFEISITPNTATAQTAINTALTNVFITGSAPGVTNLISDINHAIKGTGIDDFEITAISVSGTPQAVGNIPSIGLNINRYASTTFSLLV